ncbi:MAG: DNA repair protein RadC [Ferrovibrio sp.]|uniref:RadC family protein n=1 Tax=Ferrovibrio sp. TaxID=1917215 RepID=UPI00260F0188|nr:DNA repair protein RadC [Ferrovibrio sp.]MCW0236259.1 DNA repair protein RadC [Ferrovibrio sp.]
MAEAGDSEKPHFHGHRARLRARFLESGGAGIPDYEILELILFGIFRNGDTKPLAKALIAACGGSLAGVLAAPPERLKNVPGCGEAVIAALKVTREAGLRMLKADATQRPALSNWQALLDYCRAVLQHEGIEQFRILFLDRKNQVIADEQQQRGTVDHTPVYPREVVKRALELNAAALILVHNHPSGDPTPSRADIEVTRQVCDAAATLGIAVHDHLIIGRKGHVSFREKGLLG